MPLFPTTERVLFEPSDDSSRGGVYVDWFGRVRCLWSLYDEGKALIQAGTPMENIAEVLAVLPKVFEGGLMVWALDVLHPFRIRRAVCGCDCVYVCMCMCMWVCVNVFMYVYVTSRRGCTNVM